MPPGERCLEVGRIDLHPILREADCHSVDARTGVRDPLRVRTHDRIREQCAAPGAEALTAAVGLRHPHAGGQLEGEGRNPRRQVGRQRGRHATEHLAQRKEALTGEVEDRRVAAIDAERMVGDLQPERRSLGVESRGERADQRGSAPAGDVPVDAHDALRRREVRGRLAHDGEEARRQRRDLLRHPDAHGRAGSHGALQRPAVANRNAHPQACAGDDDLRIFDPLDGPAGLPTTVAAVRLRHVGDQPRVGGRLAATAARADGLAVAEE